LGRAGDRPPPPVFLPVTAAVALALTVALLAAAPLGARADDAALAPLEVPAKSIPVPTDVSPGMQKFIAAPLNPVWHDLPSTLISAFDRCLSLAALVVRSRPTMSISGARM
jgi:hypothetical protein